MLGFFFKKNFYDGWDNVILLFIPNLIFDLFLLAGGGLFFLGTRMNSGTAGIIIWAATILLLIIAGSILALAWAESAAEIANYEVAEIKTFFLNIKGCIKDGISYGLLIFITAAASAAGFLFYFKSGTGLKVPFIGLMAGSAFCWLAAAVFAALFLYPALRALMHNPFGKTIKKCFIILLDNLGKCLVISLYNIFLLLISVVMLGLAPGLGGIGLSRINFLRLLLKKYDYLEKLEETKNNGTVRTRIKLPWKEILAEDIELTGSRTFRSFMMPWKE